MRWVGGCIDSATPGMGHGGLQPHTARGTLGSHNRSHTCSAPHQCPRQCGGARGRLCLSIDLSPAQKRCQGATGLCCHSALDWQKVCTALCGSRGGGTPTAPPRYPRGANASQTTANKLSRCSRSEETLAGSSREQRGAQCQGLMPPSPPPAPSSPPWRAQPTCTETRSALGSRG